MLNKVLGVNSNRFNFLFSIIEGNIILFYAIATLLVILRKTLCMNTEVLWNRLEFLSATYDADSVYFNRSYIHHGIWSV
jgi:hypothetical protein